MKKVISSINRFLIWSCRMAGKPLTFVIAWIILLIWGIFGFIWGFSNTWILIIDTIATINASLMVFIIQNTQNRESKALHLKLDGIIRSLEKAEKELIAIETIEEIELEKLRKKLFEK